MNSHRSKTWFTSLAASAFLVTCVAPSLSEPPRASSATGPATRPVGELLHGIYRGTVVDDDQVVPCVTRLESYRGKVKGRYTVREGDESYSGTLDGFVLVNAATRICRFQWHDKHGTGLLTIQVSADGSAFAGSWGKEVIQDELIWTGTREPTATRPHSPSGSDAGKVHP